MNDAFGATLLAPDSATAATLPVGPTTTSTAGRSTTFARSTVLPRKTAAPASEQPRFEPIRSLGEGGMGEVLLVQDHDIGRKVAVKRLRGDQQSEAAILRFAEEVRTVGHLEHPGIVPVHDVGVDEQGQHYLVMKYVEGETLETVIQKLREGSPEHRARYTQEHRAQVCLSLLQALRYAHEKGVIHRDLKPANVMVGRFGEVMLMDWGIAKQVERGVHDDGTPRELPNIAPERLIETQQGALLGTPMYMSPEQAAGKVHELDERSDIYSAGLLFLELFTLEHPYAQHRTIQSLLLAQAHEPIGFARILSLGTREGIKAEYVWFLVEALQKDPSKRYRDVAAMEDRLTRLIGGEIPVQCHVTFAKRTGQEMLHWIDRHPRLYSVLFFATLLLMLASLVLTVLRLVL